MSALCQIADIRELLLGETGCPHLGFRQFEDGFGRDDSAGSRNQAVENSTCGFAIELLEDVGAHKSFKARSTVLHAIRADALDDRAKRGIRFLEVADSVLH